MKPVNIIQKWKGTFNYRDGYEDSEQYKEVEFIMEITLSENSFVGISTDSESKNVFDQPATVKGFIDDEKINFIMKYPCAYFKDESGKITLNRLAEHPEIQYLGFFDSSKSSVRGNWEIIEYEEKYLDGYIEEISNGEFVMKKIN